MNLDRSREVEFLKKARAGDREAVELLYEKYLKNSAPIQKMLRAVLNRPEDREDALHDILITILESKSEFRGESQLNTYIFQIAQISLFQRFRRENALRRGGLIRVLHEPDALNEVPAPESPHYTYEKKETREIIRRIIDQLPKFSREAVRLRIMEDLSYEEVSERLQVPYNTAATKIHKGKKILLQKLRALGHWKTFFPRE